MVSFIFLLALAWYGFGDEKARKEEENPRVQELKSLLKKVARRKGR